MPAASPLVAALAALHLLAAAAPTPPAPAAPPLPRTSFVERSWRIDDGLPQDVVTTVAEDGRGFLWVGTETGLARFDGTTFRPAPGPLGRVGPVTALAHDRRRGTLWIGAPDGLWALRADGATRRYGEADGLPAAATALHVAPDGALWAGTRRGPARHDASTDRFSAPAGLGAAAHHPTRAILVDAAGRLWVGTDVGLAVLPKGATGARLLTDEDGLPSAAVAALASSGGARDELWVGAIGRGGGLARRSLDATTARLGVEDGLPSAPVTALLRARDGALWIGTRRGLARLEGGRLERIGAAPGARVETLFQAEDGSVWAGTYGAGLVRYHESPFVRVDLPLGRDLAAATTLRRAADGGLWVGTRGRGIAKLALGRVVVRRPEPTGSITSLWEETDGALTVALDEDPDRLWRVAGAVALPVPVPRSVGRWAALHRDRAGILWAAGARGILAQGARGAGLPLPRPLAEARATTFLEDAAGALWIGTGAGLWRVTRDAAGAPIAQRRGAGTGLPHEEVTALLEDRAKTLWVATAGGLARWDEPRARFVAVGAEGALPAGPICSLVEDATGALWVGTAAGIVRLPPSGLRAAEPAAGRVLPLPFGRQDGLASTACARADRASATTADGRLWILMRESLVAVDPARLGPAAPAPVYLEEARADGVLLDLAGAVAVPAGTRLLELRLASPRLVGAERTALRYRVRGFDDLWRWTPPGRPLSLTGLPPGRFLLEAAAATEEGRFGPPVTLGLVVAPRLHQRWWVWGLGGLAAALLLWRGQRLRERLLHARHEAVLAERARVGRELHDTLLQGVSGLLYRLHALRARVAGDPDVRAELDQAMADAARELAVARRSLMDVRSPDLEDEPLPALLAGVAERARRGGPVELDLPEAGGAELELPPLDPRAKEALVRIAEEALRNAARHGRARRRAVRLRATADELTLEIADDGQGFDPARLAGAVAAGRFGVAGMKERARLLGGSLTIDGAAGATRVVARVPVGRVPRQGGPS